MGLLSSLMAASLGAFIGCSSHGKDTSFALRLHPDSSCVSAPVGCVDHLKVKLDDLSGAPMDTWNLSFTTSGGAAPLGKVPASGNGRFRVVGVAGASAVTVFSGTSGIVAFDPKADQGTDVNVSCPVIADPCATSTPTPLPTPPLFVTGTAANLALGQADLVSCVSGITTNMQLLEPDGLITDDTTQLFISDRQNGRVAVWSDKTTLTNGQRIDLAGNPANGFVIGHSDTATGGNSPGGSTNRMNAPRALAWIPGVAIIVADQNNNRLPIFTPTPAANNADQAFLIGQGNNSNSGNTGTSTTRINSPYSVAWNSTAGLFVSDTNNNRILGYGKVPAAFLVDNAVATLVLGQTLFTNGAANHGGGAAVDGAGLNLPAHIALSGKRLYVVDQGNNRVLVWNDVTTATNGKAADFAIGQPNLTSNAPGAGTLNLAAPRGVSATKDRLVIADTGNNRILIWQPPPNSSTAPATQVLGQPDFNGTTPNIGGSAGPDCSGGSCVNVSNLPTASSMYRPSAVWLDGNDLWVSDTCNHRAVRYTAH